VALELSVFHTQSLSVPGFKAVARRPPSHAGPVVTEATAAFSSSLRIVASAPPSALHVRCAGSFVDSTLKDLKVFGANLRHLTRGNMCVWQALLVHTGTPLTHLQLLHPSNHCRQPVGHTRGIGVGERWLAPCRCTKDTTMHDDHCKPSVNGPLHPSYITFVMHCIDD
jgi:hypothetical protein